MVRVAKTLPGIGTEDGEKILYRLGGTLLYEHEKLFGCYWRQVYALPTILTHLAVKGSEFLFVPPRLPRAELAEGSAVANPQDANSGWPNGA